MRLVPQQRKTSRESFQPTSRSYFFALPNINGVFFFEYRGKSINVDFTSRPLGTSFFSFTSSVRANDMDRRFDHSLRLEIVFVLYLPQRATSGKITSTSTVSTPPPPIIDRMVNDELRELVHILTRSYGRVEISLLRKDISLLCQRRSTLSETTTTSTDQ